LREPYLELSQVHIESTVEAERSSDGRYDLSNEPIEIGVSWALNVEVPTADVINGLVVDHEGAVGMFQCGVGCQDGVVGFDDGS
jgi:hypothetical protein